MFLQMNFYSKELGKATTVNVLIPEKCRSAGKPYKTMWLLHGLTDDHTAWMRYTSIERYANEWGIAVVMPNADRSWYTNTAYGVKYFDFIAGASFDETRVKKNDVIDYALKSCKIEDLSKVIMIGDREHDVLGASCFGIDSIGVLWGYGSREELEKAGATYIAQKIEDIQKFII